MDDEQRYQNLLGILKWSVRQAGEEPSHVQGGEGNGETSTSSADGQQFREMDEEVAVL